MVTANGNPSGIATTTIVTARINALINPSPISLPVNSSSI
jgi:hypothetical protein